MPFEFIQIPFNKQPAAMVTGKVDSLTAMGKIPVRGRGKIGEIRCAWMAAKGNLTKLAFDLPFRHVNYH